MQKFYAHMHVGQSIEFVADSWEDGGFATDSDGNPTHDSRRNTVAGFSADPVTSEDAVLLGQAYAGDEAIVGKEDFTRWLKDEAGLEQDGVSAVIDRMSDSIFEACAYCRERIPLAVSTEVPAADDDERWAELAEHHEDDCEWIATRAHRLEVEPAGEAMGWPEPKPPGDA